MSCSLFPIRAIRFANELSKILPDVEKYNAQCSRMKLGEGDGRTRMVLSSPGVGVAIRQAYEVHDFRARFAFYASGGPNWSVPQFELYSVDGVVIATKPVNELPIQLEDAICIELVHVLLVSKGVDINMY